MIHNKFRYILTLVALFAMTAGAWAQEEVLLTTVTATGHTTYSQSPDGIVTVTLDNIDSYHYTYGWLYEGSVTVEAPQGYTITRCVFKQNPNSFPNRVLVDDQAPFTATMAFNGEEYYVSAATSTGDVIGDDFMNGISSIEVYGTAEAPIEVTPVAEPAANTKQWTFSMPASDVVLTPVYSAATVYTFDGQAISETPYETLKEAFAKVKEGDVITLDWDVTLTEQLQTPTTDGGVKFMLDFNGYTIDGGNFGLSLMNQGDQLTFTDSSEDQMGGLKCKVLSFIENSEFVFDAGRYNILTANAETLNGYCSTPGGGMELADGKEFIDLEGGAEANDGFTTRVDFKTFELAIGPKEFDTFYADKNIVIDAETAEGINLYTITAIDDDRSEATLSSISGTIAAGTPMLVYNSTEVQKLVKIKFTAADASTAATAVPEFKGTAVAREFTADDMTLADYYALSGGKAFAYVKNAGTIAANQCWLQFDKPQPGAKQRAINIVFEEGTTELDEIENDEPTDDTWYDLNGRKLKGIPATKGVFIKNGKKVMK